MLPQLSSLNRPVVARLTFGAILVLLSVGCKSKEAESARAADSMDLALASQATAPQAIDELVAPIALYPDQLLGQMLIASTNSQEVLDLGNWLIQNPDLKTDAAPAAAKTAGFSTSAQYLAAFPQVVDNMCQQLDWTKQLGEAYKADPGGVMAAVQRKRSEAQQVGNLKSTPQMTVESKEDQGKEVIEIAPADPQVVYVPQYNTQTIYTTPAPTTTAAAPTQVITTEDESGVSTEAAVGIGLLSFGVGMALGNAFDDDDYPYPSWGYGGMYYGGAPYYPPAYRPPVYAGYRPATAYNASNYRWNDYNRDVNVRVNNDDYYNRYRGTAGTNATRRTAAGGTNAAQRATAGGTNAARRTTAGGTNAAQRTTAGGANAARRTTGSAASSGYLGGRSTESPSEAMARANPRATTEGQRSADAARAGGAGRGTTPTTGARASTPTTRSSQPSGAARREAGAAPATREPTRTAAAPTTRPSQPTPAATRAGGGDRGYATSAAGGAQPSRAAAQRSSTSGGALGSGRSSGGQERAASSRGRSSMGAAQRGGGGGGRRR